MIWSLGIFSGINTCWHIHGSPVPSLKSNSSSTRSIIDQGVTIIMTTRKQHPCKESKSEAISVSLRFYRPFFNRDVHIRSLLCDGTATVLIKKTQDTENFACEHMPVHKKTRPIRILNGSIMQIESIWKQHSREIHYFLQRDSTSREGSQINPCCDKRIKNIQNPRSQDENGSMDCRVWFRRSPTWRRWRRQWATGCSAVEHVLVLVWQKYFVVPCHRAWCDDDVGLLQQWIRNRRVLSTDMFHSMCLCRLSKVSTSLYM